MLKKLVGNDFDLCRQSHWCICSLCERLLWCLKASILTGSVERGFLCCVSGICGNALQKTDCHEALNTIQVTFPGCWFEELPEVSIPHFILLCPCHAAQGSWEEMGRPEVGAGLGWRRPQDWVCTPLQVIGGWGVEVHPLQSQVGPKPWPVASGWPCDFQFFVFIKSKEETHEASSGGSLIVCTTSGHYEVSPKNLRNSKAF